MEIQVDATVMGTQTGEKKDKTKFYKVDLYLPGVGAFDKTVEADEFVKLSALPAGTPIKIGLKLSVREEKVQGNSGDRAYSFSVRRLGVTVGALALPENARKAS